MNEQIKTSPIEKWITNPVNHFIIKSSSGGIVLFTTAMLAIFIANSQWSNVYHHFWEYKIGFFFDSKSYLTKTLHEWINDGLMAIFFFVVGLELKREIIGGELSSVKKAILPIFAAFGGMVFPAIIYIFFNNSGEANAGWGIPMATDIGFALGVLFLLGNKIPNSLKVFLTALAIADDLGAVLVIAFFYTSNISMINLAIGLAFLTLLFLTNKIGVRSTTFYGIVGVGGVWLFFLMSGVHATIAAVLLAFTIPADAKVNESTFVQQMKIFLEQFKKAPQNENITLTHEQLSILEEIRLKTKQTMTPLQRLEYRLHPIVTFIILPVFAFANAGVTFSNDFLHQATTPIALGIIFGLIFGKFIGIVGVSTILIKLKLANFPSNMNFRHLFGVALLASIGFTMSLFVTSLAFENEIYILEAKIGIFIASLIGGILGYLTLNNNKTNTITND
jgi:NhaA family Na+:H+ antiporter